MTAKRGPRPWIWMLALGGLSLVIALGLLAWAALAARRALQPDKLRAYAESRLSAALARPVHIGSVQVDLWPMPSVGLSKIRIDPVPGALPFSVGAVRVHPEFGPLLEGRVVMDRVDVRGLVAEVHRDRSGRWLLPVRSGAAAGPAPSGQPALEVRVVTIADSRLRVVDESLRSPVNAPLDLTLGKLAGALSVGAGGAYEARLAGETGGGSGAFTFSRRGSLSATAKFERVSAAVLAPLLWSYARLAPRAGKVDMDVTGEGRSETDFTAHVAATFSDLVSPGFGTPSGPPFSRPLKVAVDASLARSGPTIVLPSVTVRLAHTSAKGAGRIEASGARLDLNLPDVDGRDLPDLMALVGMSPIPGLTLEGRTALRLTLKVPAGPSAFTASGVVSIARVRLGTLGIEAVRAPFVYGRGALRLDPFTFSAYKGLQKGAVTLRLDREPASYSGSATLTGLDVNEALTANTSAKDMVYGTAEASGSFQGAGFGPGALTRDLSGGLDFKVTKGVLKNFPLLADINRALKITGGEGKDTAFDKLRGHFDVAQGRAHSEEVVLKAGELRAVVRGDVFLDSLRLAFDGAAAFSPQKSKEMVHGLSELARLQDPSGQIVLPLRVRGTLGAPDIQVDVAGILKKQVQRELEDQLKKLLSGD